MKLYTIARVILLKLSLLLVLFSVLQAQNENIGGTLTGEPLLEYLQENYSPNSTLGYNTARDRMYTILDNFDGVVVCVYTYFEVPVDPNSTTPRADAYDNNNGINAEHLWPQSKGAGSEPARSDLHSLYASEIRVNADRANFKFGNIPDEEVNRWYNKVNRDEGDLIFTTTPPPVEERHLYSKFSSSGDVRFEAKLDTQGDIARAMFYFYTMYQDEANAADPNFFSSMNDALLSWHDTDEVSEYELWRTETISDWQGNVNPFVADTTLVRRAFFMGDGGEDPDDPDDPEDPDPIDGDLVFYESFGTPSSTSPIGDYSYDNGQLSFEGNGDIRSSIPSAGYDGASGAGLVFMNQGERFLTIGDIDTSEFEDITLSFGVHAGNTDAFTIEYSTNAGSSWTAIDHGLSQPANEWTLLAIENTGIPSAESVSIRFSKDNGQQYRLDDITLKGTEITDTSTEPEPDLPAAITLEQNYPNPFNPTTSIRFSLAESQNVTLSVYDMLGRRIAVLMNENRTAGNHTVSWDASQLSSGVYIYRIETPTAQLSRKMTLVK